jgi:hypothetical protein
MGRPQPSDLARQDKSVLLENFDKPLDLADALDQART